MSDNVFILSADSLRLDRTGDDQLMPFLVERGDASTRFTNAVANGPFTPASFPAMLASRYASSIDGIGLPAEGGVATLAEQLAAEQYETAFWSDNKFVGEEYNYDRGYDVSAGYETGLRDTVREHIDEDGLLFSVLEFGYMRLWKSLKNTTGDSHYYATAAELNETARNWLAEKDPDTDSVHVWCHYMDTHHPYEPAEEWMPYDELEVVETRTQANNTTRRAVQSDGTEATPAELRDVERLYDAECRSLDAQLRQFVTWLEDEGWLQEDDLLVVTSDHGEVFSGTEQWSVLGHENVFTEECTRVPLLIDHAGLDPHDVSKQCSLIDLLPTILELLGVETPDPLTMGDPLQPLVSEESADREHVFYDGTLEYNGIRTTDGRKVFNCETEGEATYLETTYTSEPVAYDEEPVRDGDPDETLLAALRDHESRCATLAEESQGIDPESLQVEQHMRDLGYLE